MQGFSLAKVNKIPNFNTQHTSLLSWTLAPSHSRPDVAEYNSRMSSIETGLNASLAKYNNSYNLLLKSIMPECQEFVLECSLKEGQTLSGSACCDDYFNPEPILNQHGKRFYFMVRVSISLL